MRDKNKVMGHNRMPLYNTHYSCVLALVMFLLCFDMYPLQAVLGEANVLQKNMQRCSGCIPWTLVAKIEVRLGCLYHEGASVNREHTRYWPNIVGGHVSDK